MAAVSVSTLVSRVNFGPRQLSKTELKCRQHCSPAQFCSMWGQGTVSMRRAHFSAAALSEEQAIHHPRPAVLICISMGKGQTSESLSLSLQMTTNHGAALSLLAGVQESTELWVLPSGWRYCFFNRVLQDGCAVFPVD